MRNIFHKITGYRFTKYKDYRINLKKREEFFKDFDKKYLHVKKINNIKKQKDDYEIFSVGSDQVWNPNWLNFYLKNLFVVFYFYSGELPTKFLT